MSDQTETDDFTTQMREVASLVEQHLLPLMVRSQLMAMERYKVAKNEGATNFLFAVDSWWIMQHHFFRAIKDDSDSFPFEGFANHGLSYGEWEIRWHRVGTDVPESSENLATPRSSCRAGRNVAGQQELFSNTERPDDSPKGNTVIVAYTANPEVGLTGVYVTTVGTIDQEHVIVEWDEVVTVWEREETYVNENSENEPPAHHDFDVASAMNFGEPKSIVPEFDVNSEMTMTNTEDDITDIEGDS